MKKQMRSGVRHNLIEPRSGRNHKPKIVPNGLTMWVYDQLWRMAGHGRLRKVQSQEKLKASVRNQMRKALNRRSDYEQCIRWNSCMTRMQKVNLMGGVLG